MSRGLPGLALACLALTAAAVVASAEEPVVDAVELRLDAPLGRTLNLEALLDFGPGDRLDEEKVRRSLTSLYATGLVSEAEILLRRDGAATTAIVVLHGRTWVESVTIEGQLGLRRSRLRRALEQRVEAPLVEERLKRGVDALRRMYRKQGYLRAKVDLEVLPRREPQRVDVVYRVDSGPRAEVGEVEVAGELGPFEAAELEAVLRAGEGETYDPERLTGDGERLRAWLVERGHLTAEVPAPEERPRPQADLVDLVYRLRVGPHVEVEVLGAEERKLVKKGLLPFLEDQTYDQALVLRTCERLRAYYQRRGHFLAEVTCEERPPSEGGLELLVEVDPGAVYTLREIHFEGNEHFPAERLLELMATEARRPLRPGSGRLVAEVLEEDLANLRSFYVLQGYTEAEVGPWQAVLEGDSASLTIPIREGPRQRVVSVDLEGLEGLDEAEVRGALPLYPAGPFHPALLEESVNLLRTLYEDEGRPRASVTSHLDWNRDRTLVDVDLEVHPGPEARVDRVVLRGHRHTRSSFLHRHIGLESGDLISRRRLLKVERDLYRLGIFSRVEVELAPSTTFDGRRDVLISLEEGRRWRFSYGLGYHSEDGIEGILGVSRSNVDGRGGRLQFDLRGSENDRSARFIFDQPSLGGWNLPITYTLFLQDENLDAYDVRDLGVQAALTKELSGVRLGLTYDFRLVELSNLVVELPEIDREDRDLEISSLTPNLFIDRRDDPFDPTRGWSTAFQLEYAFPLLSAETELAKLFWQQTQYLGLGRLGILAGSLRLGAIEPLASDGERDPLVPAELPSSLVPASERFFAGGRTTHRAYERDRLGRDGETLLEIGGRRFAAGGNGLLLLNLDYRFPISGPFGGIVFFDLGNVWADWRDLDPSQLKGGVGLGFRYRSPIGPLRLEVGWKLDREPDEDDPVFFLSFGNPF